MRYISCLILSILLMSCAPTALVNYNPDAYLDPSSESLPSTTLIGKPAILGGEISAISYENGGTRLELNRLKLNTRGYPMINEPLDGEKLVITVPDKRLGGSLYEIGSYFSASGTITAVDAVTIGGKAYQILSLTADKYSVWETNERRFDRFNGSRTRFYGGFGWGLGYYPPYYYW